MVRDWYRPLEGKATPEWFCSFPLCHYSFKHHDWQLSFLSERAIDEMKE